ncbi:ECF RNA polymerase sigma factor SigJ (plasmid) [Labrenzia sp. THAF191b]|uniref:RNA polymerase sigma-70 factor n=1 Tax=unclassified Labrenzia TaxID=2648686 RepID=UPI00126971A8|nr:MULTISPECIES: RNA polymerase sigma-70 factor [unclassified Labrenzia]QFT01837.1 ECF RNA polymerase sigma factor SigJ [Labrenzia sp. THAF191b]QFT08042.1 ECF RNA polymerase sigma factor SigJ [Labrenzia sp. THAF191a]QFT19593.1 ECF RNA polymerase sigma factor SigJ [Labrenzia sp. THAF187b]
MHMIAETEKLRPRLFSFAYRLLGSRQEAEDVVQEAFLRWHSAKTTDIRSAEAWLVTVLSRLCVDRLRAIRAERQNYVGPWLPEPLLSVEQSPDHTAELASDLSMALLVVLQRLSAEERVGFLMHDVFDCDYSEVSVALGKSEAACRQLVSRARRRVRRDKPRFEVSDAAHGQLVKQYVQAVQERDADRIAKLLAPDAVFTSDGGGKAWAALHPIIGAARIARMEVGVMTKLPRGYSLELADVNGQAGIIGKVDGQIYAVTSFTTNGLRILSVMRVLNPDKLTGGLHPRA